MRHGNARLVQNWVSVWKDALVHESEDEQCWLLADLGAWTVVFGSRDRECRLSSVRLTFGMVVVEYSLGEHTPEIKGCESQMVIGQRLRELRESKKLSQGDLEKRTGLLRCYTSRVENGHTVPSVETLEKYAGALGIPMYKFFYEGDKLPEKPTLPLTRSDGDMWGDTGKERQELRAFAKMLSRLNDSQRNLLLTVATRMARDKRV